MSALTAPAPAARIPAIDDDLEHWYCCDPNVSLCGRDLTDVPETDFIEASCVVCEALSGRPCPACQTLPELRAAREALAFLLNRRRS